jgi:iron complex outermembrane receptor protein
VEHNLVAGLEIAATDDVYTLDVGLLPPMDLLDPVETATEPGYLLPDQSAAGDSRTTVLAPYITDQIVFNDRFQVLLGTRFDIMSFDDEPSGVSRSYQELSALLGAVYSPSPGVTLYANGARSFAPPSPRLLDLEEPEQSRQLELGTHIEPPGSPLRAKLAVFHLERFNIAIPDDNGFTQQEGDQRSRGLELELAGQITSGLRALLAYAYTDAVLTRFSERVMTSLYPPTWTTLDRSGNRPAFVPEHQAKLWLHARITSALNLGLGARYVGPHFIAEDNVTELDGYLLLSLAAGYALGPWHLSLHLDNLLDEAYDTRGFGGSSVIPGEPFAWRVGVEYRY